MKRRANTNPDYPLYLFQLLSIAGIVLFLILSRSTYVSLLFYTTFLLLLCGILRQVVTAQHIHWLYFTALSCVVISFFHIVTQTTTVSFEYYKKLIMFACTVLFVPYVVHMKVNKRMVDTILGINIIVALLYVALYAVGYRTEYGHGLTMNFPNPNQLGLFLLQSVLYVLLGMFYYKTRTARVLLFVLGCFLLYMIDLTNARSCLIAVAAFLAVLFFVLLTKKRPMLSPFWSFMLLMVPLFFAILYMFLYNRGVLGNFNFMDTSDGKVVTSRVSVWQSAFTLIKQNFLFGTYIGIDQRHNTHLDILSTYGFLPFVLFMSVLFGGLRIISEREHDAFSCLSIWAFYAVILMGTFEAALVSGSTGMHILSFGFLILVKYDPGAQDEEDSVKKRVRNRLLREMPAEQYKGSV